MHTKYMLDIRTNELLTLLYNLCPSGSYKIITATDLIKDFPQVYKADNDLIRQMITNLSQNGYISLRYDSDDVFCLSLTPKGRLYFETESKEEIVKKVAITDLLPYFFNFVSIFSAVFLAGVLIKVIGG